MGLESKYTAPLVGVSSAASRCSSVLFPAPEGATIATISPRRKLRFASVKTVNDRAPVPYVFLMLRASSTTGASGKPLELPAPASAPALVSKFILGPHSPLRMAANPERPPTYLDAGRAIPVPRQAPKIAPPRPNHFPFMPEPCPARNQAPNGHFVKRLIAFISNVYSGQFFPIKVPGQPSIRPDIHAVMIGANRAPKLAFPPGKPSFWDIYQRLATGLPLFIAQDVHR